MIEVKQKPKMQLSEKVCEIPEALSVYMNNIVYKMRRRGDDIRVLSLGEAYFDIPMFSFENIDFVKGYHYSESRGMPELRETICAYYHDKYKSNIDSSNEILISAGSKPLIYMAFQAVLNEGDEVLIHEPAWLSYPEEIKLANGKPVFIPYYKKVDEFEEYFTDNTKMVVICNPNNPAGRNYSREELIHLYSICRPRGIYILVDEAYSEFVLSNEFVSMANVVPDKDGVIIVNSLSKNFGISGWRIGYVISNEKVIYNILKLNQHLITCPTTLISLYLVRYFDDLIKITTPQIKEVVIKRNEVVKYIESLAIKCLDGNSTFYIFMNIGDYKYSSLELGLYLLMKYKISVVPGQAYGKSTERFIRISVGTESIELIKNSIDIIKKVIESNEYDEKFVNEELEKLQIKIFES
ncbi:aspartate aminotransferase [Pseudobutyrivibrio ruminis]|uniref:Aminotransferase n=1 Tax=Pseudobutyrivibrio ruminis TaxID=46206 RepID=A0A1H7K859_9FIRM|nr:pyridoxal phosphate-dependent aminotransferase [Pseudobutyrivibrio ruminis]SEK83009.1 aspartate aminotransferase [Pseudobutyrivibrio ruminis]